MPCRRGYKGDRKVPPYPHRPLLGSVIYMKRGTEVVPAIQIDRGGRPDHQELKRAKPVSRVPGAQAEVYLAEGALGGQILRPDCRRPNDSGRDGQAYRTTSSTRARACAACF